jgi:superfamily I DNA/RNA helicase
LKARRRIRDLFQAGQADGSAAESLENGAERRKCRRFFRFIHQAIIILEKGRFVSPWKHILVDEFQDISPQRAALLSALRAQNKHTSLFAVGDDWQAIYRFSGAQLR